MIDDDYLPSFISAFGHFSECSLSNRSQDLVCQNNRTNVSQVNGRTGAPNNTEQHRKTPKNTEQHRKTPLMPSKYNSRRYQMASKTIQMHGQSYRHTQTNADRHTQTHMQEHLETQHMKYQPARERT